MSLIRCAVLALQVSTIAALPSFNRRESGILSLPEVHTAVETRGSSVTSRAARALFLRQNRNDDDDSDDEDDDDDRRQGNGNGNGNGNRNGNGQGAGRGATPPPAAAPPAAAPPAAAPPAAAPPATGEGEKNEVVRAGTFGTAVALDGGNVKQDTEFTATLGKFEVEFQNAAANTLTVTETKAPAGKAPLGFKFLETSSFTVKLAQAAGNLTLARIDYIFDAAKVAGVDVSKSAVGKLCTEAGAFVVSEALGELEFEAEENEIVLNVKDLNGEFAVFIPTAAAAAAPPAAAPPEAAPAAGSGEGEEKKNEVELPGQFNAATTVVGGFAKQDILFPPSNAGSFEVEYNASAANAILVAAKPVTETPPAGLVFVDGSTFTVQAQVPPAAGDKLKIDYIFSAAVKTAVADPSKGLIGKRNAAGQFVTQGLGEFEFEAEENEWTLTVPNLNGEWAVFIPRTALASGAARVN